MSGVTNGGRASRVLDRALRGTAFRAAAPHHTDLREAAARSRDEPGRFNTASLGAVYASREPDTALDEVRQNSSGKLEPCAIFVLDLAVERVVDLTVADELERWGLTPDDLKSDDLRRCQEVAAAAVRDGAEAIRWPSATGSGQSLAVYLDALAPRSRLGLRDHFDLSGEVIEALERGAPLGDLLPALATFPSID